MNILGVGPAELVVILLIMLIFAGPKRMVRWAYIVGTWFAKFRVIWGEMMTMVQKEIDAAGLDIEVPKDVPTRGSLNQMAQKALKPLSDPMQEAMNEVQKTQADIRGAGQQVNKAMGGAWSEASKPAVDTPAASEVAPEAAVPEATAPDGDDTDTTPPASGFGSWASPTPDPASRSGDQP